MSTAKNKAVVARFCDLLTTGDLKGTLGLMTDDVTYWIIGRKDVIPSSGPHSKAGMERIFNAMYERMPTGMQFIAKSMIAEGDEVALEAESHGALANGRIYNNQYHIRFQLRDGKIAAAREYLDTQHVLATWYAGS